MCIRDRAGIDPTFVNVRFVKPLDTALLDQLARNHSLVVTVEENVQNGGFGQQVCGYMEEHHPGIQVLPVAIPDRFVPHGGVDSLRAVSYTHLHLRLWIRSRKNSFWRKSSFWMAQVPSSIRRW